jgi:hypothetical protein
MGPISLSFTFKGLKAWQTQTLNFIEDICKLERKYNVVNMAPEEWNLKTFYIHNYFKCVTKLGCSSLPVNYFPSLTFASLRVESLKDLHLGELPPYSQILD